MKKLGLFSILISISLLLQAGSEFRTVGYYCGRSIPPDSFEVEKLSHLIFCFGALKGNEFHIWAKEDSATIKSMVALKARNPTLKVMLSLGGWGGCEHCSEVFSTEKGRREFAHSVKVISNYFHTDGIDLDWEYPAISGFPGHSFHPEDQQNFTALLKAIREANNSSFQISFAAGGFSSYIDSSINWKAILPYCNFINIMSYDLVHGYSKISGHHTPLYSTTKQIESTDHAVQMLLKKGVPADKLVIGAAFYGRFFQIEGDAPVALYQPCHFSHGFSSKFLTDSICAANGFSVYWDSTASAPYAINQQRHLLATYDDANSITKKTAYAIQHQLGGMMFWQLYDDKFHQGLLNQIYQVSRMK